MICFEFIIYSLLNFNCSQLQSDRYLPAAEWSQGFRESLCSVCKQMWVSGERRGSPWSHRLPTQPSSQIHCQAFPHVPCRQPGKGTHWSHWSPCHPGLHLEEVKRKQSWAINTPPERCRPVLPIITASDSSGEMLLSLSDSFCHAKHSFLSQQ